jgi:hypothetical protein
LKERAHNFALIINNERFLLWQQQRRTVKKSSIEFNSEPVQFKEGLVKNGQFDTYICPAQIVHKNSSAFFPL